MLTLSTLAKFDVSTMAFTLDSTALLVCGRRGVVEVVGVHSSESNRVLPKFTYSYTGGRDASVNRIHFDARNDLVFLEGDHYSRCHSLSSWAQVNLKWENARINRIVPHPTHPIWASSITNFVTIRGAERPFYPIWEPKGMPRVRTFEFSPNGERFAAILADVYLGSGHSQDQVVVYEASNGRIVSSSQQSPRRDSFLLQSVDRVRWSLDSQWLAVRSGERISVFRSGDPEPSSEWCDQISGWDYAFHPFTQHLYVLKVPGLVEVWAPSSGAPIRSFDWNIGPLKAIALSPNGSLAAVAGANRQILLWDVD